MVILSSFPTILGIFQTIPCWFAVKFYVVSSIIFQFWCFPMIDSKVISNDALLCLFFSLTHCWCFTQMMHCCVCFSNDRFEGIFQIWLSFSPGLPVDHGLYELDYMEPFTPHAQDSVLFITVHTQSHNLIFSWVPLDSFFLNMQSIRGCVFHNIFSTFFWN